MAQKVNINTRLPENLSVVVRRRAARGGRAISVEVEDLLRRGLESDGEQLPFQPSWIAAIDGDTGEVAP